MTTDFVTREGGLRITRRVRLVVLAVVAGVALVSSSSSSAYPARDACDVQRVSIDARRPGVTRTVIDTVCVDWRGRRWWYAGA